MCSSHFSFLVIRKAGTRAKRAVTAVLLILKEYTPDCLAHVLVSNAYRPFVLGKARTGALVSTLFNDTTAALSFSFSGPTVLVSSLLKFY